MFAITDGPSVVIDPNNGPIQTWTLGANRTATFANFGAGQSVMLSITSGGFTLDLTGADYGDAGAPTLGSAADIELWSVDGATVRAAAAWSVA